MSVVLEDTAMTREGTHNRLSNSEQELRADFILSFEHSWDSNLDCPEHGDHFLNAIPNPSWIFPTCDSHQCHGSRGGNGVDNRTRRYVLMFFFSNPSPQIIQLQRKRSPPPFGLPTWKGQIPLQPRQTSSPDWMQGKFRSRI
jgi:hypothetical protein